MAHHSTAATALKEAYKSNIMALEWEAKTEEGRDHQAFAEAFWAVMWDAHQGTLNVSSPATCQQCAAGCHHWNDNCNAATSHGGHSSCIKVTPQLATMGGEPPLTASPPTVPRMLAPSSGTKQQCTSSDQEAAASGAEEQEVASLDISQEEHAHQKWKERRPLVKLLRKSHWEAFS